MSIEKVEMRLEVLKGEALGKLRDYFQKKAQYEELVKDNEINLHYMRGFLDGLDRGVNEINEIKKGQTLETIRDAALAKRRATFSTNPDGKGVIDATLIAEHVEVKNL